MTVTTTRGVKAFETQWNSARADRSEQSNRVSYRELKDALAVLPSAKTLTRTEAAFAASTMASDPVLTDPAKKEAYAFLKTVGAGAALDEATREAVKAEFALRATKPFATLNVPGRTVRNTVDLPAAVKAAADAMTEKPNPGKWATVEVKSATLAGQKVFIVHHSEFNGSSDAEKAQIFSANGTSLAQGSIWDPMAGFGWAR